MATIDKSAAVARQRAEKLISPKPPEPKYAELAAKLDEERRAEEEKTKRLRALRLAKEAAERNTTPPVKPRKRRAAST